MRSVDICVTLLIYLGGACLQAVPPLVSGDVPTAEKGTFEWYLGTLYHRASDSIRREILTTELVYGISDRQEVTFEMPLLSQEGEHGLGDITLGTKFMFVKESETLPGVSVTFELKLPSASASRGLGTGAFDYDFLVPVQKNWGWFTLLGNVGYTIVGDAHVGGVVEPRKNVWFVSSAQQCQIAPKTKLLSEVYLATSDEPGRPNTFAGDIGLEHEFGENSRCTAPLEEAFAKAAADFASMSGLSGILTLRGSATRNQNESQGILN